jgi:hypothetical protein
LFRLLGGVKESISLSGNSSIIRDRDRAGIAPAFWPRGIAVGPGRWRRGGVGKYAVILST